MKRFHAVMVVVWMLLLVPRAPGESGRTASARETIERLKADVEFLSAPALDGRASLSRGSEIAARYLAAEFQKAGLAPGSGDSYGQEFFLMPLDPDPERTSIRILGKQGENRYAPGSVLFPDRRRSISISSGVVFAGFGITAPELGYDDYAGLSAEGKIVLVFDHEPQEADAASPFNGTGMTPYSSGWYKVWNAQKHGAAALLLATEPVNSHRNAVREPGRAAAPAQALMEGGLTIPRFSVPSAALEDLFAGSGRTAAGWQEIIERSGKPASRELPGISVKLEAVNRSPGEGRSWNVAGLLPGADRRLREETVILCAHYDHLGIQDGNVYPGANDNGSGLAAMLEIARAFARERRRPDRSILFLAFGSEEQAMLGSYYYIEHPLRPLPSTRAVFNLDMIGRNEEHTAESRGSLEISSDTSHEVNLVAAVFCPQLADLVNQANRRVGMRILDKHDRDSSMRALLRCDHLPFLYRNVPAIWIFGGFHPGYHTPLDTPDKIDYRKLQKITQLTFLSLAAAADRQENFSRR